jgi:hypothetical protein
LIENELWEYLWYISRNFKKTQHTCATQTKLLQD